MSKQELLSSQAIEIDELQRLIRNYRKDRQFRKTERYLQDKKLTFSDMFKTIRENNEKLEDFYDERQPYFSEKTFEKIETLFYSVMDDINRQLKSYSQSKDNQQHDSQFDDQQPGGSRSNELQNNGEQSNDQRTDEFRSTELENQNDHQPNVQQNDGQTGQSSNNLMTQNDPQSNVQQNNGQTGQNSNNLLTQNDPQSNVQQNNGQTGQNSNNFVDLLNSTINDNSTPTENQPSLLDVHYTEFMDLLIDCHELHQSSPKGLVQVYSENLKSSFNENDEKIIRSSVASIQEPVIIQATVALQKQLGSVLLATAMIGVLGKNGSRTLLRALLDQGSQSAFITENAAQTLGLKRKSIYALISGIGEKMQAAKHMIDLTIFPRFESEFVIESKAIVLPKLTRISEYDCDENDFHFTSNLTLADPSFLKNSEIDIILGASEYAQAIKTGLIKSEKNLIAQNSEFGWVVSGALDTVNVSLDVVTLVTNVELDEKLNRFFDSKEFDNDDSMALTAEEEMCEDHYEKTHYRDGNGRYVVSIPFKNGLEEPDLGDSRRIALASLFSLERRFLSNPELKIEYSKFLHEYISSGHMHEVNNMHPNAYYMPHHAVFKESTTTKLRVVFNASQKTSNKKSLNEQMALGPRDQSDLVSVLLRWRRHKIAFTADLEKMYRQILINESQTHLQRILWRELPNDPIKEYELRTVTYGTSNAPYLAIRTLKQLSIDGAIEFPLASEILKKDFYVDDVLSGADSLDEAIIRYSQLINLTSSACLNLRKWSTNSKELFAQIPMEKRELQVTNGIIKALGISWLTESDELTFNNSVNVDSIVVTKRHLASEISSLFDPLGYFSPAVMVGKILFQQLWAEKLDWDDAISREIVDKWQKFKSEIDLISNFRLQRWVHFNPNDCIELHGFCDASIWGYAAVLFLVNVTQKTSHILLAKARVSPIKQSKNCENVTIPRLELCGALLLAQLVKKTMDILDVECSRICLWSDSKIVLDWIHANPKRYKVFIASRIAKINKLVDPNWWSHVRSEENAADCASRGLLPSELIAHPLWWHGPRFLIDKSLEPPRYRHVIEPFGELAEIHSHVGVTKNVYDSEFLPNVSSFGKLKRVMSYCIRFIHNCKSKQKFVGPISHDELFFAEKTIIKIVQGQCYDQELKMLNKHNSLSFMKSSALIQLNPFLDVDGIIRVGGRLKNSDISFEAKHQILLPCKHNVTFLIIRDSHEKCLHGGPKLTESILRQRFWVAQGTRTIKTVLRKCVKCFRANPKPMSQFMGDLPAVRVNAVEKPFTNTAVDYTGAILVKLTNGRGYKTQKAYVAIFVCMSVKAIHIEAVTDLTAEAFIAAYRRFVARRGVIRRLYSDNGTNFVKANKILMENLSFIDEATYDEAICHELAKSGTSWHFSPPGAPHFNGLAEAAVKSVKLHLKRVLADAKLTFEELSTLLTQVEACVNSRPLCPMSSDPNDIGFLSPAHFLVGEALISPPEQCHLETKASWLSRWQKTQQMMQYFWKRWQNDYLHLLQTRTKWFREQSSPKLGDMVLIKDENLPPTQWRAGRVIEIHPGADGHVRVVSLKTQDGQMKRPVAKLCAFPHNNDEASNEVSANISRFVSPKKSSFGVLPIITAILSLCVTFSHQAVVPDKPYEITRFDTSPGFYFDKTHDVYISNTNWKSNFSTAKQICFRKASLNSGCRGVVVNIQIFGQRL
ncbi:uncharacterized protein LOC116349066 [Contarinia nasturtii]|uniref:uncharacterized protein LOC116349066 n=1 Tax=Contarinia nasturtii TaxID=265458 RepID=UPI0012D3C839|nr:uncharacterized protein LOC116349066 [Contarinia nasturtii]